MKKMHFSPRWRFREFYQRFFTGWSGGTPPNAMIRTAAASAAPLMWKSRCGVK